MRVTESHLVKRSSESIGAARTRMSEARSSLTTGLRVSIPSDDPKAWAEARLNQARSTISEARGSSIARARENLVASDRALAGIGDSLGRLRALAVQAANPSLNAQDRLAIAPDVRASFDQLVADGNAQGPDGEYVLAGAQGDTAPFDAAGVYSGDAVRRTIDAGEGLRLFSAIDGSVLTAAAGLDVFAVVDRFATALETNDIAALDTAIGELEQAGEQVSASRTTGGGFDRALRDADDARTSFELNLANVISRAQEADAVVAATELGEAATALETAQAVAVRLQELLNV